MGKWQPGLSATRPGPLGTRHFGPNRLYREKRKHSAPDLMRTWCGGWRAAQHPEQVHYRLRYVEEIDLKVSLFSDIVLVFF